MDSTAGTAARLGVLARLAVVGADGARLDVAESGGGEYVGTVTGVGGSARFNFRAEGPVPARGDLIGVCSGCDGSLRLRVAHRDRVAEVVAWECRTVS